MFLLAAHLLHTPEVVRLRGDFQLELELPKTLAVGRARTGIEHLSQIGRPADPQATRIRIRDSPAGHLASRREGQCRYVFVRSLQQRREMVESNAVLKSADDALIAHRPVLALAREYVVRLGANGDGPSMRGYT